jgi:hypothetical protein
MTYDEILAKLLVLEENVAKVQNEVYDLFLQIREGLDNDQAI